jgi:cytochrome c oxidase assembly protein subunit 15
VRRLALAGVLLGFGVVVFGAYVRLTAAGLGCPDWPGCYGHVTPLGAAAEHLPALDVGKAWREMLHRYAASTLGLIIVVIAAIGVATRPARIVPLGLVLALLGVVVLQGMLGMLTVTLLLTPLIVTAHLLFGLTTVALLGWLWLTLDYRRRAQGRRHAAAPSRPRTAARRLALAGLVVLGLQIALGGWTSTNYAATACPDFPTCQHRWLPETDYAGGFVLWRGLGVDYEGGVLEGPARVAIHYTHRLGAIVASVALLLAAGATLKGTAPREPARRAAYAVLAALALQLAIGTSMVLKGFPLALATAHNAGAALLLLCVVALNRTLRPEPSDRGTLS